MADIDIFAPSSAPAGSDTTPPSAGGQVGNGGSAPDFKALYEELQVKLGAQGNELGEYRSFMKNVAPLLEKLDASPELTRAILSGKVNTELAIAVEEGKISLSDATVITEAHKQVKTELGKEAEKVSTNEMTKLVEEKMQEIRNEFNEKEDLKSFRDRTAEFIASKPDFEKYADEISKWFSEHKDQTDISIAYKAVKSDYLERAIANNDREALAEAAKNLALNATGGGGSITSKGHADEDVFDRLIASKSNPTH